MSLPSGSEIIELVTVLAPGLVILGIRQWFIAAPLPKIEDRAFAYAAVSILYYGIANPLMVLGQPWLHPAPWIAHALEYFIVPALFGLMLGVATRNDLTDRFWRIFGVHPFHHAPTAWDYAFTRLDYAPYVLVTLHDGCQVSGYYTTGSYAASSSEERDLWISELWDSDSEPWTRVEPPRSILLCGRDIRFVEFFKGPNNGKRQAAAKIGPCPEGVPRNGAPPGEGGLSESDKSTDIAAAVRRVGCEAATE